MILPLLPLVDFDGLVAGSSYAIFQNKPINNTQRGIPQAMVCPNWFLDKLFSFPGKTVDRIYMCSSMY